MKDKSKLQTKLVYYNKSNAGKKKNQKPKMKHTPTESGNELKI